MTDTTASGTSPPSGLSLRISEGPVVYVPHEELSLVDAATIFLRRWVWVALGLVAGVGMSLWWLSQSPVRYESRGVVRIGRSRASFPIKPTKEQQDMLLEPVSVASMRIREEYGPTSKLGQKYGGAAVTSTVFDREADELLTIFARSSQAQTSQDFLNAVLDEFVAGHQQLFATERQIMADRIKAISEMREKIQAEVQNLGVAPGRSSGQGENKVENSAEQKAGSEQGSSTSTRLADTQSLAAIQQLTRAQFLQQQLSLEQEAVQLQRAMIDLQSQPTVRISAASLNPTPVEPKTKFLVTLGVVMGTLLGCGLALLVEFVSQVRRRVLEHNVRSTPARGQS